MLRSMTTLKRSVTPFDALLTAVFVVLAVLFMVAVQEEEGGSWLAAPVFALVPLTLLFRRVSPIAALCGFIAAIGLHIALFGTLTRCGLAFPVEFFLVFAAGARLGWRGAVAGLVLAWAGACLLLGWDESAPLDEAGVYICVLLSVVWAIARLVHLRGRNVQRLQEQTAALRTARDERARMEVAMDRARLSADLDELLQRRLGELAHLAERGAGEEGAAATATLQDIEHGSRRTLEEMRAVVGVLRSAGEEDPVAPQPTLTHLEAMLLRAKGAEARLTVDGSPRALPAGVELSAYRIVEHLLDALDDAPDVSVRVGFGADALNIAVSGPAARRGVAATAIERARERVALHSGTLEAETRGGRAEAVAHLPIAAVA
jgi:glucose-6-phosphate-specific signal transduction histidine kinase